MVRLATLVLCLGFVAPLGACGDSCESIQSDMEQIGKEIQENPKTVFDRAKELEALGKKLEEAGCLSR